MGIMPDKIRRALELVAFRYGYSAGFVSSASLALNTVHRPPPPMPTCKPSKLDIDARIQAIELKAGDTLVVMTPDSLSMEQRERMQASIDSKIPCGAKALILDCGMTIAAITTKD